MSYIAPVKDMLFNMAHLGGLEQIAQMPAFEDAGLETAQAVLEECAKLLEARVLITQGKTNRPRHKAMVERFTRTYHDKHVRTVYHGGRKHVLCHRVEIASAHTPLTLRMHYAWDKTAQRYVIGWFDEFSQCPF